jgi:hypothetical protein
MDIQFLLCGLIGLSFLYLPFSLVFYCCLFFLYSTSLPLSSEALMEESKQKMRNSFKPMVHLFSMDVRIILIVFFALWKSLFFLLISTLQLDLSKRRKGKIILKFTIFGFSLLLLNSSFLLVYVFLCP